MNVEERALRPLFPFETLTRVTCHPIRDVPANEP